MPASRPDQNPIKPDFWSAAEPAANWSATWLGSHPLAAWTVACQVLLIAVLVLVISVEQPIAGTTPVVLLLAAAGLATLLAPGLRRTVGDDRRAPANPTAAKEAPRRREPTTTSPSAPQPPAVTVLPGHEARPHDTGPHDTGPHTAASHDARHLDGRPQDAALTSNVAEPSAALIAQMCHDLRTPLNAVIGFSSLMAREIHGPVGHPRYQEYVGHIVESGQSLLRSAEATLALTSMLSRPAGISRERCSLPCAVAEASEMLPPAMRTRLGCLESQIPPDATIEADRHGLVHALGHLFMHALAGAPMAPRLSIERLTLDILTGDCPNGSTRDGLRNEMANGAAATAIRIAVTYEVPPRSAPGTPLAVLVARTMLELQGATLTLEPLTRGGWVATATFPATQPHIT